MAWVDYAYYQKNFGGSKISPNSFINLEIKARAFINTITFNRIDANHLTEDIKNAVCAVAEQMKSIEETGGLKQSETVGRHSVSYFIAPGSSNKSELYTTASMYLTAELLYRGV